MKIEEYEKENIEDSIIKAKVFLETGKGLSILQIEESTSLKNAISYVMSKQWRSPIFQENFIDLFIKLRRGTAKDILSMCHEILSSNIGLSEGEKNSWCDKVIKTVQKNSPNKSEKYIEDLTTSIMDVLSQEIEELDLNDDDFFDDFNDVEEVKTIDNLPSKDEIIIKNKEKKIISPSSLANDFLLGNDINFNFFNEKMNNNEKFSFAFINALNNKQLVNEINGEKRSREKFLNALYWLNDINFEKSWNIFTSRADSFLIDDIKRGKFRIIWIKIIKETRILKNDQKNIAIKILKKNTDFSIFKKQNINQDLYKDDVDYYFKTGMYSEKIIKNSTDDQEKIKMGDSLALKYVNEINLAENQERPNNYKPDKTMELFCDFLVLLEYDALSYTLKKFLDIYYESKGEYLIISTKRKLLFFLINKLKNQLSDDPDNLKKYQNEIIEIMSGISNNSK